METGNAGTFDINLSTLASPLENLQHLSGIFKSFIKYLITTKW